MKNRSILKLFIVSGFLFLMYGCRKEKEIGKSTDVKESSLLISNAQNLVNELSAKSEVMCNVNSKQKIGSTSSVKEIVSILMWEKSSFFKTDSISYIIVPLNENPKSLVGKDHEFIRRAIFYSSEKGQNVKFSILEILSKNDQSIEKDADRLVNISIQNNFLKESLPIDKQNAYIIFYNENYSRSVSFKLENGTWSSYRVDFNNKTEVNNF